MWLEKPFVSSCNPSVYYNWSERPNIVLHEHRFTEVRDRQRNNFCSGSIELLRPRHHLEPTVILRHPDQEICVLSQLEQYIEKNKDLRKDQNLSMSFVKTHRRITASTIFRWCVRELKNAGVDVTIFGSHSTRSASTTHCKKKGLSMKEINKQLDRHLLRRLRSITINRWKWKFFKDCIRVLEL